MSTTVTIKVSPPGGKVFRAERAEFCRNSPSTTLKPDGVPLHNDDDDDDGGGRGGSS